MKLSQFKFKLPEDKIALHPTKYRDESRLMVLHRNTGKIEHRMFKDVSTIQRCSPLVCTVIKKRQVLVLKYSYCVS